MMYIESFVISTHFPFCPTQVCGDELAANSCADVPVAVVAGFLHAFCSGGLV